MAVTPTVKKKSALALQSNDAALKSIEIKLFIAFFSTLIVLGLLFGSILGLYSYAFGSHGGAYVNPYPSSTKVGVSSEVLGTAKRVKPVAGTHDGGLPTGYPVYGKTLSLTTEQKDAILRENKKLCGTKTTNKGGVYDWMDKDGYLYTGTRANGAPVSEEPKQLYKHTGSVGLYYGNVADDEPSKIKRLTFRPRSYTSYYDVTGLYAPAGEVIKIEISNADMEATGGIVVHIGQALYNGQANDIWAARGFNRMPFILNTMYITKETAEYDEATGVWTGYVGSFLGGPIYIRDKRVQFSVTISGGVDYPHFILGVTTEDEYNQYKKSSAPYFDLEIWDSGVLHSGPINYAKNFSYNDLYQAAILWEKITLVTTRVSNQGVVFIYDPFVAAGAAVAFPGRRSVNCPAGWMSGSLNYNAFVTSGSWGNMHEYHHNFQNYGVGYTGEVTNNALNLVSYSLFTKISSARQIGSYGGAGLSGWNQYTSAAWALQRVNSNAITSTNGLAVYATLMHNLGQDAFIKSTRASGAAYFNKWATNTHQDFSYYASLISSYSGALTLEENDYPMFVPVSSVYQTGRSYMYDGKKRYIETMQPFVIPYGESYTVDLNPYTVNSANQYESGSVVIGNGFKYSIKTVNAKGINGSFKKTGEGIYTFKPNSELLSGKIYVTLEIATTDGARTYNGKALNDVDLVLEFQQTHETNKAMLEKTVYTFAEDQNGKSAVNAFKSGYTGYISKQETNNVNFTQNSNTDVWLRPQQAQYINNPETAPYVVNNKQIFEIKGKLYFPEAGKYRIYLRGRQNCALFISRNGGKTYSTNENEYAYITKEINKNNSADFLVNDSRTYIDVDVKAEEWIYFKEVLITVQIPNTSMASFVGLGLGSWTVPMYTAQERYVDKNGNQVESKDDPNYHHTETRYLNASGQEVTAEEASNTTPIAPTRATYVTAYRQSYEFMKKFTSDYFYTRDYTYDYRDNHLANANQTIVSSRYNRAPNGWGWGNFPIENLVDGNRNTWIHTSKKVSQADPFEVVIDMGEIKSANSLTLYSQSRSDLMIAKSFTLYGSLDGENFFTIGQFEDVSNNGATVSVNFKETSFRYFKLSVFKSTNYLIISEIEIMHKFELLGGMQVSPDDARLSYLGNWHLEQTNSNFGHVYVGGRGAQVTFKFTGTQFAILSSKNFDTNFIVYIDGCLVYSREVLADDQDFAVSYLSPELANRTHNIIIKCLGKGTGGNIDSIVLY